MSTWDLTAERLFERFFLPWYPPEARADLSGARASDANPGKNPTVVARLDEIADVFAKLAPEAFGAPDLSLDRSDASVHRLGGLLSRELRDRWAGAQPSDGPPLLVQVVTHGAVYVGACAVRSHGAEWLVRRPLWESLVRLRSHAGVADLAVFHWWLKALSDEEIGRGRLVDRYRTHVEVPAFDAGALRVIASPDRRIPRLAKARYDMLHMHLRAHLPELRAVGDDFPSPERFEELAFRWLDFVLVGGGRMLLVHGPTDRGVHLFWLDAGGFVKSAFYPADRFPEHVVKAGGDKLAVAVPIQGKTVVHEMLWWGL